MDVKRIEEVHALGYGLEELEFEAARDLRVSVGGLGIACRGGETIKVPYWIGRVMEEDGLGSLRMPDMVTALKQALSKERMAGTKDFPALEPLFYVKLKAFMRNLGERDRNKVHDMLLELFRSRSAKIVVKASSMKLNAEINAKLTVEEQGFYNLVNAACADFERQITKAGGGAGGR